MDLPDTLIDPGPPVDYECATCGLRFAMAGEFDGRHGDPREELPTPCPELAVPVDDPA